MTGPAGEGEDEATLARTTDPALRKILLERIRKSRPDFVDPASGRGSDLKNTTGMSPDLVAKLEKLRSAMPAGTSFSINSGFRTHEEQAELYAKYGAGRAAPPGRSRHERGEAADLQFSSEAARRWVHENSRRFGVEFPLAHEPWHAQALGTEAGGGRNVTVNQKTEINVQTADPAAAGRSVASAQTRVNADIVRNAGASLR
jgi:hypothetical protein